MGYQKCIYLTPIHVFLLCTTLIRAQSTNRVRDTCVYSFSVPKTQRPQYSFTESGCPGMTQLEHEFEGMKRTGSLQQEQLAAMITQQALTAVELEGLKRTVKLQQEQIAAMMTQQSLAASEYTKLNGEMFQLLKRSINSTDSGSGNTKHSIDNSDTRSHSAVTYIRWGRTVCPSHAQRLYLGYVGGSHHGKEGGGANYLCLPQEPQWTNKTVHGFQGGSKVWGAHYYLADTIQFSREHNSGQSLLFHSVPCAACHVPQRSSHIMIPGMVNCPTNWTMEYMGYIVVIGDHDRHPVVYICLDEAPEVGYPGEVSRDGPVMFSAEVQCGSLPCPKYVNGWELSCVVCAK